MTRDSTWNLSQWILHVLLQSYARRYHHGRWTNGDPTSTSYDEPRIWLFQWWWVQLESTTAKRTTKPADKSTTTAEAEWLNRAVHARRTRAESVIKGRGWFDNSVPFIGPIELKNSHAQSITTSSAPNGVGLSSSISSASVGMTFPHYGFPSAAGYPGPSYEKVDYLLWFLSYRTFQGGFPYHSLEALNSYSSASTADSTSNTSPHLPYTSSTAGYPYQPAYPGSTGSMPFNSPFSQYGQPSPGASGLGTESWISCPYFSYQLDHSVGHGHGELNLLFLSY